jgi:hypothetical protein
MGNQEIPELPGHAAPERSHTGPEVGRGLPGRVWKILAAWAVLTAVLIAVINECVHPLYESASLVRVEPARAINLFGVDDEPEVFAHYLQTQVELIKSPSVVSSALAAMAADFRFGTPALLREARDPESEIRGRLDVRIVPGTYLIRVALASPQPNDSPAIVNTVVQKYQDVATAWSNAKNDSRIKRLDKYSLELSTKIREKEDEAIQLAQKDLVDLQSRAGLLARAPSSASGNASELTLLKSAPVSIDEYRQVRQRLFETDLKLLETEALLNKRNDNLDEREAGDPSLRALNEEVGSLRLKKSIYEKLLPRLKLLDEQAVADSVKLALVREDLDSFREMRSSVDKRIEQLKFDAQGEARINVIDPAKQNRTPIKDYRRKLFLLAPVAVLPLVLGLFLGLPLLSGRRTDRDLEEQPTDLPEK